MKHSGFLLINPPIYDFAAYDLWAKPVGLLQVAAILNNAGAKIRLIDYLDRNLDFAAKTNKNGCGHYISEEAEKPKILKNIPRKYYRYGIPKKTAQKDHERIFRPDAILVSSAMTYWYPGVFEAIATAKEIYPDVPVILGGIYATICPEHAKEKSGADYIIEGSGIAGLFKLLCGLGINLGPDGFKADFADMPAPMYELYERLDYAALKTSHGCPFECTYCASKALCGNTWTKKPAADIIREIEALYNRGVRNFAFYDDALLVNSENHIIPLLNEVINRNLFSKFHTPNGIHARYITKKLAGLFRKAGFVMPRVSFETSDINRQALTGGKVSNQGFISACDNFRQAGYGPGEYGAYVLMGMPGQNFDEIERSINFVHGQGAKVFLVEYSPIPKTKDWENIKGLLPYNDPLWHNNSIFPLYPVSDWPKFQKLKDLAHHLNNCFT